MASFVPTIHPWNQELWQNLTLEPERSNHALLFCGDAGLGKRDLAIALAHFVMAESHSQSEALFSAGSHPDLHVLMPEAEVSDKHWISNYAQRYLESHSGKPRKTITIDQVRRLSTSLATHPHISDTRVILIFSIETMNRNAANAVLKNLEEPPANTLFILVTDELSKLLSTIRSRCSLLAFRPPDHQSAKSWLSIQKTVPEAELETYLALANNHPLQAQQLFASGYMDAIKRVFSDVNQLWAKRCDPTQSAKQWQEIGASRAVDILQKITVDLLKCQLSAQPASVFFPVQLSWLQGASKKLDRSRLLAVADELAEAKKMLATTVDELLVLESVAVKMGRMPA